MVTFIYMTMRNLNLAFISSQRYLLIGTDQLLILVFIFILICYVVQTITILIFFISKPMFITYMWFIMKVGPVLIINFRFFIIFSFKRWTKTLLQGNSKIRIVQYLELKFTNKKSKGKSFFNRFMTLVTLGEHLISFLP